MRDGIVLQDNQLLLRARTEHDIDKAVGKGVTHGHLNPFATVISIDHLHHRRIVSQFQMNSR